MKSASPVVFHRIMILVLAALVGVMVFVSPNLQTVPCGKVFFLLPAVWGVAYMALVTVLLRQVEAREGGLAVLSSKGETTVAYRDMAWVFELPNNRGRSMICLKFFDHNRQKNRIMLFLPSDDSPRFGESPLTEFIRSRIEKAQPAYSRDTEPKKWMVVAGFFLSMVLLVLIGKWICPEFPFPF